MLIQNKVGSRSQATQWRIRGYRLNPSPDRERLQELAGSVGRTFSSSPNLHIHGPEEQSRRSLSLPREARGSEEHPSREHGRSGHGRSRRRGHCSHGRGHRVRRSGHDRRSRRRGPCGRSLGHSHGHSHHGRRSACRRGSLGRIRGRSRGRSRGRRNGGHRHGRSCGRSHGSGKDHHGRIRHHHGGGHRDGHDLPALDDGVRQVLRCGKMGLGTYRAWEDRSTCPASGYAGEHGGPSRCSGYGLRTPRLGAPPWRPRPGQK